MAIESIESIESIDGIESIESIESVPFVTLKKGGFLGKLTSIVGCILAKIPLN
jgi:hypothetical protein